MDRIRHQQSSRWVLETLVFVEFGTRGDIQNTVTSFESVKIIFYRFDLFAVDRNGKMDRNCKTDRKGEKIETVKSSKKSEDCQMFALWRKVVSSHVLSRKSGNVEGQLRFDTGRAFKTIGWTTIGITSKTKNCTNRWKKCALSRILYFQAVFYQLLTLTDMTTDSEFSSNSFKHRHLQVIYVFRFTL